MNTVTVVYFFLAILFSFLIVYFQYFFKEKKLKNWTILAFLRFITLLSVFIILINPQIVRKKFITVKPELIIAVDNSESIALNKQDTVVRSLVSELQNNRDLNNRFRISTFSFGESVLKNSDLTFKEDKTNIYNALAALNSLFKKETAPIVMISDGNQTYGNDYKYLKSNQSVYPIIVGDTVIPSDLRIDRINVNSFSYLDHNFPAEVFIQYSGKEEIRTKFIVKEKNKIIYSKNIFFSKNKNSKLLSFKLPSESIGKHLFVSSIIPFKKEKNIINNTKNFAVEVIDEQSNIGLVYDKLHPDIGMLKRSIETNKQRKVQLIDLNTKKLLKNEIDAYILYQPNSKFQSILKEIKEQKKNYFIITGINTDWNFLNDIQSDFKYNSVQTTEKYFPVFNSNFSGFYLEDIGFSEFPPLDNIFGTVKFSTSMQTILFNKVNGIEMNNPLLAVYEEGKNRRVVLFGENIWKWRSTSYRINKSFTLFDQFMNNIIQYLSTQNRKVPIELEYQAFYHANEQIKIKTKTYGSNFNFDNNAELELKIKGVEESMPFHLTGSNYEINVSNLKSGNYNFIVKDIKNRNQVSGSFTIGEFSVEQEFSYSNAKDLNTIAKNSGGSSFYPKQKNKLIDLLLQNKKFKSTQKEVISTDSLIDWKWLLGLIIVSLTLEWSIRKYRGLA